MEQSTIIPSLLDTAAKIFTVILDSHRSDRLQRNHAAADLLKGIGDTLDETADFLEQDRYPTSCCGRLREYALLMPEVLAQCVNPLNIDRYTTMLLENYQVEMLLSYFHRVKPIEKEQQLEKLRSAAGAFHVASEMLRPE